MCILSEGDNKFRKGNKECWAEGRVCYFMLLGQNDQLKG